MNKSKSLTEKQAALLQYIKDYKAKKGYIPSIDEMAEKFGISKHAVDEKLRVLEQKKYIERDFNKARGIRILDED
jgi:SOS-response transcriptional repressor LexA